MSTIAIRGAPRLAESGLAALPGPILLLGAYGYDNAGDEAMLAGFLEVLGRERVTVISRRPARTHPLHGVRSVGLRGAPLALLRHRTLLIGGGALFGRDMGLLGRFLPLAGLGARALGRTVALAGINIDRDTPRVIRPLLRALGRRCAIVEVRDQASVELFAALGVKARYAPDLSAHVEPAGDDAGRRLLEACGVERGRPVVGLALTAVEPLLAAAVEEALPGWLAVAPNAEFVFVPTSRHPFVPGHDDLVFARRLVATNPRLRVIEGPVAPSAMLSVFGELDVVVAMRYHALHFARRMGIPLVPLPYAPKCSAWCEDEGIEPASVGTVATRVRAFLGAAA